VKVAPSHFVLQVIASKLPTQTDDIPDSFVRKILQGVGLSLKSYVSNSIPDKYFVTESLQWDTLKLTSVNNTWLISPSSQNGYTAGLRGTNPRELSKGIVRIWISWDGHKRPFSRPLFFLHRDVLMPRRTGRPRAAFKRKSAVRLPSKFINCISPLMPRRAGRPRAAFKRKSWDKQPVN